jgi:Protein of unknown function, DUF547
MEPDREIAETLAALRAAHFDAGATACDYASLAASRERGRVAACLAGLDAFDPKGVRIGAQTAFWINVFNAAVVRDAPELELAEGERDFQAFFERKRLKVFGHPFSLDDIYHGLLRGNLPGHGRLRAPMSRDDPRLAYMPIAYDERVHFAMYTATRASPGLRAFDGGKLDVQLEEATAGYIQRMARVERNGALVVAPKLLQWYAKDFGGEHGVLQFVAARLDEEQAEHVDRNIRNVKLRYAEYDWTLNRRQ